MDHPPLPLDPIIPKLGSWRIVLRRKQYLTDKAAFAASTDPFTDAEREQLTHWLENAEVRIGLGKRSTPADLLEVADALHLASSVAFCRRIHDTATDYAKRIDPKFAHLEESNHRLLRGIIQSLLEHPASLKLSITTADTFNLEPEDLPEFIAGYEFEDNGHKQRPFQDLYEEARELRHRMETETDP